LESGAQASRADGERIGVRGSKPVERPVQTQFGGQWVAARPQLPVGKRLQIEVGDAVGETVQGAAIADGADRAATGRRVDAAVSAVAAVGVEVGGQKQVVD